MCGGHIFHLFDNLLTEPTRTKGGAGRLVQVDTIPVAKAAAVNCPRCRSHVSADFSWCPTCGASLKSRLCAYCGQMVKPGETACVYCGAPAGRGRS